MTLCHSAPGIYSTSIHTWYWTFSTILQEYTQHDKNENDRKGKQLGSNENHAWGQGSAPANIEHRREYHRCFDHHQISVCDSTKML